MLKPLTVLLFLVVGCGSPRKTGAPADPPAQSGDLSVAVSGDLACVLAAGLGVYCWGGNTSGQLGVPPSSLGFSQDPRLVPKTAAATSVSVGRAHACVTTADDVLCWGSNGDGRLGVASAPANTCMSFATDGGDSDQPCQPTPTALGVKARAVDAGPDGTCLVDEQGDARCFGPSWLDLGGSSDLIELEVASRSACGRTGSGELSCVGDESLYRTAAFDGLPSASALAVGRDNACIVSMGGEVVCWGGSNSSGQVGAGHTNILNPWESANPISSAVDVVAGDNHFCALLGDGGVACWGRNESGQVGLDPGDPTGGVEEIEGQEPPQLTSCPGGPCYPDAVTLSKLPIAKKLAAGGSSTCIVSEDAEILCWGAIVGTASPQVISGPWAP